MNGKKRIPIIFLFLLLRKIYLATISMPNCNGGGREKDSCPSLFFEQQTLFIALSFCLSLYQPIKAEESGRFEKRFAETKGILIVKTIVFLFAHHKQGKVEMEK